MHEAEILNASEAKLKGHAGGWTQRGRRAVSQSTACCIRQSRLHRTQQACASFFMGSSPTVQLEEQRQFVGSAGRNETVRIQQGDHPQAGTGAAGQGLDPCHPNTNAPQAMLPLRPIVDRSGRVEWSTGPGRRCPIKASAKAQMTSVSPALFSEPKWALRFRFRNSNEQSRQKKHVWVPYSEPKQQFSTNLGSETLPPLKISPRGLLSNDVLQAVQTPRGQNS